MAEEAAKSKIAKRARRQEQRAERLAVLDAARRVLQKTGSQEISLDEVASEAGVDVDAVTRHFQSKNELLLSLAADALTNMARVARNDIVTESGSDEAGSPAQVSDGALSLLRMAENIVSPPSETPVYGPPEGEMQGPPQRRMTDRQRRASDGLRRASDRQRRANDAASDSRRANDGASESREPERPSIRKKNLRRLDDLQAVLNNTSQPEQRAPVDPAVRLERKVQLLEHTVTELVEHNTKSEHGNSVELSLLQESVRSLGERIDVFERQYRDSVSHLRSLVAETAIRSLASGGTESTDAPLGTTMGEDDQASAYDMSGDIEPTPLGAPEIAEPAPMRSGATLAQSYLLAARQAANQSLEDATKPQKKIAPKRVQEGDLKPDGALDRSTWLRYALIGGVTLILLGFAARVAFDRGVADAAPPVQKAASPDAHAALPAASPQVKVSTATGTAVKSQKQTPAPSPDSLAKLAQNGNAEAELLVGLNFLEGDGVKQIDADGAHWLQLAANKGNAVAEYWLGTLYAHGKGVAMDDAQAVHWYEASAKQGNVKAMNSLARAYATGAGTKQDMTEAANWFGQGAALGFTTSEFNLAVLYEHGTGVPQSRLDAYMWYAVAAAQGDSESKLHIEALKAELSDAEREAAEGAAKAYKPAALNAPANDIPSAAKVAG